MTLLVVILLGPDFFTLTICDSYEGVKSVSGLRFGVFGSAIGFVNESVL